MHRERGEVRGGARVEVERGKRVEERGKKKEGRGQRVGGGWREGRGGCDN